MSNAANWNKMRTENLTISIYLARKRSLWSQVNEILRITESSGIRRNENLIGRGYEDTRG